MDELTGRTAPLAGVRVVDLSRVLAGPVLHDGARRPRRGRGQGRAARGRRRDALLGPALRGRRGRLLPVGQPRQAQLRDRPVATRRAATLALELCAGADVVIENFKVGGADRLGVGYEAVRERNPRVVYCSITGFGSEREPPGRPGYDFVAQAESGLMSITGPEDGPPYKVGVALVDVLAGLHAAAGDPGRAARRRGRPDRGAAARQRPRGTRERGPERAGHRGGAGAARERAPEHRALPGLRDGIRPARGGRRQRRTVPRALLGAWGWTSWPPTSASPPTPAAWSTGASSCPLLAASASASARPRSGWRARRGRRAGREGAHGARGARRGRRGRAPGHGDGRAPDRRAARPRGLADLGRRPRTEPSPPPLLGEHTAEVLRELGRSTRRSRRWPSAGRDRLLDVSAGRSAARPALDAGGRRLLGQRGDRQRRRARPSPSPRWPRRRSARTAPPACG